MPENRSTTELIEDMDFFRRSKFSLDLLIKSYPKQCHLRRFVEYSHVYSVFGFQFLNQTFTLE